MAIRVRRGDYNDLDTSKLLSGEFAVCLDNGYVFLALSPTKTIKLGTADTIDEALRKALEYVESAKEYSEQSKAYRDESEGFADNSERSSFDSEAWAKGTKDGEDVSEDDETYENNSKYYSEQSKNSADDALATKNQIDDALQGVIPEFDIDWNTGELLYTGTTFTFYADDEGCLHWALE